MTTGLGGFVNSTLYDDKEVIFLDIVKDIMLDIDKETICFKDIPDTVFVVKPIGVTLSKIPFGNNVKLQYASFPYYKGRVIKETSTSYLVLDKTKLKKDLKKVREIVQVPDPSPAPETHTMIRYYNQCTEYLDKINFFKPTTFKKFPFHKHVNPVLWAEVSKYQQGWKYPNIRQLMERNPAIKFMSEMV
jgi:hypothetical protein